MFRPRSLVLALMLVFVPALSNVAEAQSLKDRLKAKVKDRATQRVDESMDKAVDGMEGAITCVVTDKKCIAKAEEEGKPVRVTDKEGAVLEERPARQTSAGAWANYDFVPGERVLFADDFSNDRVGNFPQRLEFLYGNAEVVEVSGKRYLRATSDVAFAVPLPETLPERFTIEFDVSIPWWGIAVYAGTSASPDARLNFGEIKTGFVWIAGVEAGLKHAEGKTAAVVDPRSTLKLGEAQIAGQLHRIRVHADGKYVKVYLDEHRIANVPTLSFARGSKLIFETTGFADGEDPGGTNIPTLVGNISVNAGGRDMYDALMADGRVVTQGIFFDVGSDRLRPESGPTMKIIADMLKSHADLRLAVEGHTDNTGNAASNQTLSEKRAQAIVAALRSEYGIDAARLQATGFGASKPAGSNDTSEGRQQNRRVELAKI